MSIDPKISQSSFGAFRTWRRNASVTLSLILSSFTVAMVATSPGCGATWSVVAVPSGSASSSSLLGVDALNAREAWAVGNARHAEHPASRPFVVHWDGTAWTVVNTPPLGDYGGFRAVDGSAPDAVWAVGSQEGFIGERFGELPLIEKWDGNAWRIVPAPIPPNSFVNGLSGIKTFSSTDAWAVGAHSAAIAPTGRTLIEHWNGTSWVIVPSPNPGLDVNALVDVDGAAPSDVWAVGTMGRGEGAVGLVLHWNGEAWSHVALPETDPALSTIHLEGVAALSGNAVWIVGRAWHSGHFRDVPYFLHHDGQRWQRGYVDSASHGSFTGVTALSPTQVYAVGGSTIWKWNGATWISEPAAVPGILWDASAVDTGTIWAVGSGEDAETRQNTPLALLGTNG
jgi:hypothetical protein